MDVERRIRIIWVLINQLKTLWVSQTRINNEIKVYYRCTVHFEIYAVHTPTNALFINLVTSLKFTLNTTIISLLHVSVFNDHHQGALSVPN